MDWFRFYHEALDDPKVQLLPENLFKTWVNLLCLACRNGGVLPELAQIAFALHKSHDSTEEAVARLARGGLFVRVNATHWAPHNWNKRQYKSDTSTERVKRFRNVSETPPDTDTDTERKIDRPVADATRTVLPSENQTEHKRKQAHSYPKDFEQFWSGYPRSPNMSKTQAVVQWKRLSPEDRQLAHSSVERYCEWLKSRKNPRTGEDHPVVHACRYLSQRRFEGFVNGCNELTEFSPTEIAYLERQGRWRNGHLV